MDMLHTLLLYYLLIINPLTFAIYGVDKWKARHGKQRIAESTLLMLAAVGGSIGAWAAMYTWRHKTQHKQFTIGIPAILVLQLALCFALHE